MVDSARSQKNRQYARYLGVSLVVHVLGFLFLPALSSIVSDQFLKTSSADHRPSQKSRTLVIKRERYKPKEQTVVQRARKIDFEKLGFKGAKGKDLSFNDLNLKDEPVRLPKFSKVEQVVRPGTIPSSTSVFKGIRFAHQDLKQMAEEELGKADAFLGDKISVKYEIPEGSGMDELNQSELRLYSFLKRGAKKYVTSVATVYDEYFAKNPHFRSIKLPNRQVMTGRMTYDKNGNIKQIKMIRWTHIEPVQNFFENVLKKMEVLENPPKELWARNGEEEFVIFMTLEING